MSETVVKMERFSTLLMVEVELWSKYDNVYKSMYLTVDTGASVTTIANEILHQLGYEAIDKKKTLITTASGVEYVSNYKLDKIKMGGIELEDINVYAHKFPEECFSLGVLGLNVLQCFDIEFLFSKKLIKFKKIISE